MNPVGAGALANTGGARAIHRGACFAGMPAPTGIVENQTKQRESDSAI